MIRLNSFYTEGDYLFEGEEGFCAGRAGEDSLEIYFPHGVLETHESGYRFLRVGEESMGAEMVMVNSTMAEAIADFVVETHSTGSGSFLIRVDEEFLELSMCNWRVGSSASLKSLLALAEQKIELSKAERLRSSVDPVAKVGGRAKLHNLGRLIDNLNQLNPDAGPVAVIGDAPGHAANQRMCSEVIGLDMTPYAKLESNQGLTRQIIDDEKAKEIADMISKKPSILRDGPKGRDVAEIPDWMASDTDAQEAKAGLQTQFDDEKNLIEAMGRVTSTFIDLGTSTKDVGKEHQADLNMAVAKRMNPKSLNVVKLRAVPSEKMSGKHVAGEGPRAVSSEMYVRLISEAYPSEYGIMEAKDEEGPGSKSSTSKRHVRRNSLFSAIKGIGNFTGLRKPGQSKQSKDEKDVDKVPKKPRKPVASARVPDIVTWVEDHENNSERRTVLLRLANEDGCCPIDFMEAYLEVLNSATRQVDCGIISISEEVAALGIDSIMSECDKLLMPGQSSGRSNVKVGEQQFDYVWCKDELDLAVCPENKREVMDSVWLRYILGRGCGKGEPIGMSRNMRAVELRQVLRTRTGNLDSQLIQNVANRAYISTMYALDAHCDPVKLTPTEKQTIQERFLVLKSHCRQPLYKKPAIPLSCLMTHKDSGARAALHHYEFLRRARGFPYEEYPIEAAANMPILLNSEWFLAFELTLRSLKCAGLSMHCWEAVNILAGATWSTRHEVFCWLLSSLNSIGKRSEGSIGATKLYTVGQRISSLRDSKVKLTEHLRQSEGQSLFFTSLHQIALKTVNAALSDTMGKHYIQEDEGYGYPMSSYHGFMKKKSRPGPLNHSIESQDSTSNTDFGRRGSGSSTGSATGKGKGKGGKGKPVKKQSWRKSRNNSRSSSSGLPRTGGSTPREAPTGGGRQPLYELRLAGVFAKKE